MTLEDLAEKMDTRFDKLDGKVDSINTTVAVHSQSIAAHDRENAVNHEEHKSIDARLDKVEKWMWFTLGAGGAAGAGLAKLFMSVMLACCCCAALADGAQATNEPPIRVTIVKPQTRAERTAAMRAALKVDEATREARRYEAKRRRMNEAAAAFHNLGTASNAVVAVSVDFKTGDIRVQWADGSCVLRRFDPALTNRKVAHPVRPAKTPKGETK